MADVDGARTMDGSALHFQREVSGTELEEVPFWPRGEFIKSSKARHKRRLQDRWRCRAEGHSYCFIDPDLIHVQLTEDKLDEWVTMMHDGYATLLDPPRSIIPSKSLRLRSDAETTCSTMPGNTVTYQRPFRFRLNTGLSDLRSWHNSVRVSSTSSGLPGLGYLSGKAFKWIGEKMLDAIMPLAIRRRMWLIKRLIKRLENEPEETRWRWLLQREKSINRLVDNLLELSSENYNRKYQEASVTHASRFNTCLSQSNYDNEGVYWLLSSRISPLLFFLHEDNESVNSFGRKVREILLQEDIQTCDTDHLVSELVVCACNELDYGTSTTSRLNAFELIHQLYFVPAGFRELERLGRPGGLLHDLVKKAFSSNFENYKEKWSAVIFFVDYGNDHPPFRKYVLGSGGLALDPRTKIFGPANGQVLPASVDWDQISWPCRCIGRISDSPWLIPSLLDLDICQAVVQLLLSHQFSGRPDIRIDYSIIRTLRNLVVAGDGRARRVVHDALTVEARDILKNLGELTWDVARMGKDVRQWIAEIRRSGHNVMNRETPTARKVTFDLRFRIPDFPL